MDKNSAKQDWTVDLITGRPNSSSKFLELVDVVEKLIRDSAHDIVGGNIKSTARAIMAHLAHEHGLAPKEVDDSEEDFEIEFLMQQDPDFEIHDIIEG